MLACKPVIPPLLTKSTDFYQILALVLLQSTPGFCIGVPTIDYFNVKGETGQMSYYWCPASESS